MGFHCHTACNDNPCATNKHGCTTVEDATAYGNYVVIGCGLYITRDNYGKRLKAFYLRLISLTAAVVCYSNNNITRARHEDAIP